MDSYHCLSQRLRWVSRNMWEKMALLRQSWSQMDHVIHAQKIHQHPFPKNIYTFPWMNGQGDPGHPMEFMEYNTITFFHPLREHGVQASVYGGQTLTSSPQANPDVALPFENSSFIFQGSLGYDLKTLRQPGLASSYLLPVSPQKYQGILLLAQKHHGLGPEMEGVLRGLIDTCGDWQRHLLFWAENAHRFGPYYPPLRLPSHFNDSYLTTEARGNLEQAHAHMKKASDFFFLKRFPQNIKNKPSQEVEDLMDGSFFQNLE